MKELKVVPATFLLVCFVCLKRGLVKQGKMFFIHFKALLILEIASFKFLDIQMHYVIKCVSTKHILLNNLGSKYSLVMKFGQFI